MPLRDDIGGFQIGVGISMFLGGGVVTYAAMRLAESRGERNTASDETIKDLTRQITELKKQIGELNNIVPRTIEDVKSELENLKLVISERRSKSRSSQSVCSYRTAWSEDEYVNEEDDQRMHPTEVTSEQQSEGTAIHAEEKKRALYARVDSLYAGSDDDKEEAMRLLQDNEIMFKDDWEFLWRLGRSHISIHEMRMLVEEKKIHALAGHSYTKQALDVYEASSDVHKWYAIGLGTMNDYVSTKDKILNGYALRDHVQRALELSPNEPTLHFMMGRWCWGVFMLTWIERKLAATLFATPPSSTVEDALNAFLKAEEIDPGFYKANQHYIGKCYYEMSRYAEAKKWLESAKELSIKNGDDQNCHNEVLQLLAKL